MRRLVSAAGHPVVAFQYYYDYLGRRIRTVEFSWSGSAWVAVDDHRLIYNGWNLIAEFWGPYAGGSFPTNYVRHSFWGLDLSGSLSGAGGVGGLLMVQEGGNSYLPAYDALGNVHAMIKASDGSLAAAYEYDAFGQTLRESGPYAASNPFRFATKYTDIETGLVQYNTRYYSPSLGRFINRDTIGEAGGLNLYAYVNNGVPNSFDVLGMDEFDPPNTVEGRASIPRFVNTWGRPYVSQNAQFWDVNVVHHGAFDGEAPGGKRTNGFFGTAPPPRPSTAGKYSQNAPGQNRSVTGFYESDGKIDGVEVTLSDGTVAVVDPSNLPGVVEAAFPASTSANDPTTGTRNDTSPWELGVQWLSGTGPRHQDFSNNDPVTRMLQQHAHIEKTRVQVANNIASGGPLEGTNWEVTGVSLEFGTAQVRFHVENSSTINSATHPPVIGYTETWNRYIGERLNRAFSTGPMSRTTQTINWMETIKWPPKD